MLMQIIISSSDDRVTIFQFLFLSLFLFFFLFLVFFVFFYFLFFCAFLFFSYLVFLFLVVFFCFCCLLFCFFFFVFCFLCFLCFFCFCFLFGCLCFCCCVLFFVCFFFFSSRRRHTRFDCDWSSDVCSSDLLSIPADLRALLRASPPYVRVTMRSKKRSHKQIFPVTDALGPDDGVDPRMVHQIGRAHV